MGRSEHCRKRCIYDLCGIHRSQLRRMPGSEAHPYRRCGRGTKAESWLCSKQCGVDNAQKALDCADKTPSSGSHARATANGALATDITVHRFALEIHRLRYARIFI